jgi:hypothetical protein
MSHAQFSKAEAMLLKSKNMYQQMLQEEEYSQEEIEKELAIIMIQLGNVHLMKQQKEAAQQVYESIPSYV